MSEIWNNLIQIQDYLISSFERTGTEIHEDGMNKFNHGNWINRVGTSDNYRRAHIDIVDARDTKGLWMMHCCVFPHVTNPGPIFGFDVVAGRNKMTGAFHDFSPTIDHEHLMIKVFGNYVSDLNWKKQRELPDWAKAIFSEYMVAAGNVTSIEETSQVSEMVKDNIDYYINEIGNYNNICEEIHGITSQNHYAYHQKQNPHTPKTMTSLGLNEDEVKEFVDVCLFPDIKI